MKSAVTAVLYTIVTMLALVATAEAKETQLLESDHGLLGTMKRMHCPPQWLSVVMRENNILEAELNSLLAGITITAPNMCDTELPAKEDREITRRIFARQNALKRVEIVQKQNNALINEAAELRKNQEAELQRALVVYNNELAMIRSQRDQAHSQRAVAEVKKEELHATWGIGFSFAGLGVLLTAMVWYLWWWRLNEKAVVVYKDYEVLNGKQLRTLKLYEIYLTCPDHPNDPIKLKNIEKHLREQHSGDRFEEEVISAPGPTLVRTA